VVKYNGHLRDDEFEWMEDCANTADLVIVLGTSLGGLNADKVAKQAAERSLRGKSLGTVCINLQQTPEDGKMSLRIFGKSDDVLAEVCKSFKQDLATNLGLEDGKLSLKPQQWIADNRILVPYDAEGHRIEGSTPWMWLDLSPGKEIKITDENNIQGCKQPAYKHIGVTGPVYNVERKDIVFSPRNLKMDIKKDGLVTAVREGPAKQKGVESQWKLRKIIQDGVKKDFSPDLLRKVVLESSTDFTAVFDVPRYGACLTGVVSKRDDEACCFDLDVAGASFHLGTWWLEAAGRGALKSLPVTNVSPHFAPTPITAEA